MEFNQTAAAFSKKDHFTDTMKRFVSEEAAIFTPEGEEAASASFDRTAEKLVRFSADKHKANVVMFTMALLMVLLTLYLAQVARLMTHQHHVDDSLADSVLASLVADDIYYFETYEMTGTPVIRFRSVDEAHGLFVDCMNAAIAETPGFYYNFAFDSFICYEVEGSQVKVTSYNGPAGNKSVSYGSVGSVRSPKGDVVRETSAYGRVRFDIKNIIDGSFITKTKDIYCTLEINN